MGRQLQTSTAPWRGVQTVIGNSQGGTGENNAVDAVESLGGIHISKINQPNGIAGYDPETGKLAAALFNEEGVNFFGFSIQGPNRLAHGTTGAYRITDLSSKMEPSVSVSAGSVQITGEWMYVTAPESGTEIILSVGVRRITIQLVEPGLETPFAIYPVNQGGQPAIVPSTFVLRMSDFIAEPITWTAWQDLDVDTGGQSQYWLNSDVISFEIEGRRGESGMAWVRYAGVKYDLGEALTNRVFSKSEEFFDYRAENGGNLRVRFGKAPYRHVSTDWEIATDAAFNNLVFSSYEDTNNLKELVVTLPAGVNYFARCRYNGMLDKGVMLS